MTATLEGTYLDPKLVIHIDDANREQPIFDGLFKEMVKGGSEVALELQEYLKRMDDKQHETPEDTVQFAAIEWDGETCHHGIPVKANCLECEDGIAPSTGTAFFLATQEVKRGKVYGKTKSQRRPWYKKLWAAIWEVTE